MQLETQTCHIDVRWDELDSNGHVNNKWFQSYLDEARMRAMRAWGMSMQVLRKRNLGPVITGIELKFKREVDYPERLRIESDLAFVTNIRAQFIQKLFRESDGALACEAVTTWSVFDLERRRPVPLKVLEDARETPPPSAAAS